MKILWFFFLALTPIYLFESGGPQLAHIPLLLLFLWMFFKKGFSLFDNPPLRTFTWFVGYALLVNLSFLILSEFQSLGFLFASLYLIFNMMTLSVAYRMAKTPGGCSILYWALVVIGGVQLATFFVIGANYFGVRYMAFFNNPNQLASWATLTVILCSCMLKTKGISSIKFLCAGGICSALVLLSASRGGVLALGCIFIVVFWRSSLWIKALVFVVGLLAFSWAVPILEETAFFTRTQTVFDTSAEDDRHWTRVWEFPEYNILGAGGGEYDRFDITNAEIHSRGLTILFCYGIPGVLFFLRFLKTCSFRSTSNNFLLFLLPLFPTFMSHNMLRMTSFYVVLGAMAALLEMQNSMKYGSNFLVHKE